MKEKEKTCQCQLTLSRTWSECCFPRLILCWHLASASQKVWPDKKRLVVKLAWDQLVLFFFSCRSAPCSCCYFFTAIERSERKKEKRKSEQAHEMAWATCILLPEERERAELTSGRMTSSPETKSRKERCLLCHVPCFLGKGEETRQHEKGKAASLSPFQSD